MPDKLDILNQRLEGRDAVAKAVFEILNHFRNYRQRFEEQVEEVLQNVWVTPFGSGIFSGGTANPLGFAKLFNQRTASTGKRALKTPESWQIKRIQQAILMSALFGGERFTYAKGRGFEDIDKADTATALVQSAYSLRGTWPALFMAVGDCQSIGCGWVSVPHVRDIRPSVPRRTVAVDPETNTPILDDNGSPVMTMTRAPMVMMDDPRVFYHDWFDVWVDPSSEETPIGTIEHFVITADKALAKATSDDGVTKPAFDMASVKRAIGQGARNYMLDADPSGIKEVAGLDRDISLPYERYVPLEGYRFKGEVFWDPADGIKHRLITILNGVTVQDDPYPYVELDGRLTDLEAIRSDLWGGTFYPPSPLMATRFLQDVSDHTLMLWVEAVTQALRGVRVVDSSSGLNAVSAKKLESLRSGEIMFVPGSRAGIDTLKFDQPFQNGPQVMGMLSSMMKGAAGANDPVQGIPSSGDQTATEFQAITQSSMAIIEMMATVLEHGPLPAISSMMFSRYFQFLTTPKVIQRVGEKRTFKVTFDQIDGQFDFSWQSSRHALTKGQRAAALQRLTQTLATFPQLAARFKSYEYALQLAEDLNTPDAFRLIATDEEMAAQAAQMAAMQMIQNPEGGAKGGNPSAPASTGFGESGGAEVAGNNGSLAGNPLSGPPTESAS